MKSVRYFLVILIVTALLVGGFSARTVRAASLVEVTNFGNNPSSLRMFLYVPTAVKQNAPILVAVHYCHGDGPAFFAGSQYDELAEQYGYIVIYPSVTQATDGCFDVSSSAALTRGGGSDPVGIMSMVNYVLQNYSTDSSQIYVTGVSSGAMMTNVLLGDYPDVFKAGAAFAGVPFGCFAVNPDSLRWSNDCATGVVTHTAQEWGDIARAAYPGYSGPRPRFQIWHGTADTVLSYVNFGEEIKQWTNVFGISQTPTSTDTIGTGMTRTRYTNSSGTVMLEAISLQGVPHNLPVDAAAAIHFFGLDGSITPTPSITPGGPTFTPTRTPTITYTPSITPTPAPGLQIKIQGNGPETNSISNFYLQIANTGATALTNLTWRLYFNTENGNAASGYALEKYYDQSGVATVSGPTLACGNTYYFTVSYGTTTVNPGTVWSYNTALHLSSYASTFNGADDWWHTGYAASALPAAYTLNSYIPGYVNGTRLWGSEPTCSGVTATVTSTPTRTLTAAISNTPTATATRTLTPAISPTRTATAGITNTLTRTATVGITHTPTRTPTVGMTNTSTRTLTPAPVTSTATRTVTPTTGTGGTCSPVTSTITAPFTFDGAGTYCWQASTLGSYLNSWNLVSLSVNGTSYSNVYVTVSSLPAKIGGYWYIAYNSAVSYGHFEAK